MAGLTIPFINNGYLTTMVVVECQTNVTVAIVYVEGHLTPSEYVTTGSCCWMHQYSIYME